MDIQLKISDEQARELLAYYQGEYKKLELKQRELLDLMAQLGGQPKKPNTILSTPFLFSNTVYNKEWSWTDKARFALKGFNKCLTAKEIVKIISSSYETEILMSEDSFQNAFRALASTLSTRIKDKSIFGRYKPTDGGEFKVGLIEWFDADGNPLNEYRND
ncbi:MAG: hypothetical protein JSS79_19915 [Bacteroidetes bacterium]|nr:hypothetical protein [Bacteroidota bacterium]